jgi:hypothetical protein
MAEKYDILQWYDYFIKSKDEFDIKLDAKKGVSAILLPGRFYILKYKSDTDKRYNGRPVIISLGLSEKDPKSYLCIDLCVMPLKIRLKFIETYFKWYMDQIWDNINRYPTVEMADKQTAIKNFNYSIICKAAESFYIKNAIKKYKMENVVAIYSIPFSKVYRVIGEFCDENKFINGTIAEAQAHFLKQSLKKK